MKPLLFGLFIALSVLRPGTLAYAQAPFTQCAAAFVGETMVVDQYTPTGQSRLAANAAGTLTVQTVALSPNSVKALDKLDFKVAIRDKATGTLHLFSDETYRQVPVQRVLANCQPGDHIVLLTVDRRYSLPHNEIQIR